MEIAHRADEAGISVPTPFRRDIRVLLAPDRHAVDELTFSLVEIPAGSGTDEHVHDRIELIFIVGGEGTLTCEQRPVPVAQDDVVLVRAGELHQVINSSAAVLRLATVFVPGYPAAENYARCLATSASPAGNEVRS